MKFDDLCKRLDESNEKETVAVSEHTEKVLEALIKRGLLSEDSTDLMNE